MKNLLAFVLVGAIFLALPCAAETITLDKIKVRLTLPKGFEEYASTESGAVYRHKQKDWQISLHGRPFDSQVSTQEGWFKSAVRRAERDSKVTKVKIPGTVGAYIAQHKDSGKAKFWGRLGIYTQQYTYDITFMTAPRDSKKVAKMVKQLASTVKFLK